MKWIGKRISFLDGNKKTTLVIYPQDITWVKAAMGAWVGMWYAIGGVVIWSFFVLPLSDQEKIILAIFLAFWFYFAFRVTRSFFWFLWGKEMVKIDEVAFYYKKSIKGYGKSVPYYIENIKKMEVILPKEKSIQAAWEKSPWVPGGERIEFEYLGKPVRFGRKLNQKDTELLFKLVTKKINDRLKGK